MWVRLCLARLPLSAKALPHIPQLYGLSIKWEWRCLDRLSVSEKILSHIWQLEHFSPISIHLCLTRLPIIMNVLLHTLHLYGFSPMCFLICNVRLPSFENSLLHSAHLYCFIWDFTNVSCFRVSHSVGTFTSWFSVEISMFLLTVSKHAPSNAELLSPSDISCWLINTSTL